MDITRIFDDIEYQISGTPSKNEGVVSDSLDVIVETAVDNKDLDIFNETPMSDVDELLDVVGSIVESADVKIDIDSIIPPNNGLSDVDDLIESVSAIIETTDVKVKLPVEEKTESDIFSSVQSNIELNTFGKKLISNPIIKIMDIESYTTKPVVVHVNESKKVKAPAKPKTEHVKVETAKPITETKRDGADSVDRANRYLGVEDTPDITISEGLDKIELMIKEQINKRLPVFPFAGSGGGLTEKAVIDIINEYADKAGGSNTSVQYNDNGILGGDSYFTYDSASYTMSIPNILSSDVSASNMYIDGTDIDKLHTSYINEVGELYISGTNELDNSIRFALDEDTGIPAIEKKYYGAWQKTEMEFAAGSIYVGKNMKYSAAGHELMTERSDDSQRHLYARSTYSGGYTGSDDPVKILNLEDLEDRITILNTNDNLVGPELYLTITSYFNQMLKDMILRIDGVDATEPVKVTVYEGDSSFTGPVVWEETYPAEMFSVTNYSVSAIESPTTPGRPRFLINPSELKPIFLKQEIWLSGFTNAYNGGWWIDEIAEDGSWFEEASLTYTGDEVATGWTNEVLLPSKGLLQFEPSQQYAFRFRSGETMSLKAFIAYKRYKYHYNDFLVTREWDSVSASNYFDSGDWHIDHDTSKIYVCNTAGDQYGTFADNYTSGYWDELGTDELAKKSLTTGLLSGGVTTQTSVSAVDWTAGTGIIVDYTDPTKPDITELSWDAEYDYTITDYAEDGITVLSYDRTGAILQHALEDITSIDYKNYVFFGSVMHVGGQIVGVVPAPGNIGYDGVGSYKDFINLIIGPANIDGNIYTAADGNLGISVVGGSAMMLGSNYRNNANEADIITLPSATNTTFARVYRDADPEQKVIYETFTTSAVDPTKYDNGTGTLQNVTTDYWTLQRIFRGRSGLTYIAYGQQEFSSKDLALEALGSESFEEKSPLPNTLFRATLLVKQSATDLGDTDQAEFFAQSSFRVGGVQSSTSTIPGVTSPGGDDMSVQYNSNGTFGGDDQFTYDYSINTLTVPKLSATNIDAYDMTAFEVRAEEVTIHDEDVPEHDYVLKVNPNNNKLALYEDIEGYLMWKLDFGSVVTDFFVSTDIMGGLYTSGNPWNQHISRTNPTGDLKSACFGNYASETYIASTNVGVYHLYEDWTDWNNDPINDSTNLLSATSYSSFYNTPKNAMLYGGVAYTVSATEDRNYICRHWQTNTSGVILHETIKEDIWNATNNETTLIGHGAEYVTIPANQDWFWFANSHPIPVFPEDGGVVMHWEFKEQVPIVGNETSAFKYDVGWEGIIKEKITTEEWVTSAFDTSAFWDRNGTMLSPKNVGDSISATNILGNDVQVYNVSDPSIYTDINVNNIGEFTVDVNGGFEIFKVKTGTVTPITASNSSVILRNDSLQLGLTSTYQMSKASNIKFEASDSRTLMRSPTGGAELEMTDTGSVFDNDVSITGGDFTATINGASILSNGVVATTQTAGDNSTKVATTQYVDSAIGTIITPVENLDVDTGTEVVDTIPLTSGSACFWNYYVKSGTNLRAGTITACWDSSGNISFTETSTTDLGSTSDLSLSVAYNSPNIELQATATSDNWIVKANRELLS